MDPSAHPQRSKQSTYFYTVYFRILCKCVHFRFKF